MQPATCPSRCCRPSRASMGAIWSMTQTYMMRSLIWSAASTRSPRSRGLRGSRQHMIGRNHRFDYQRIKDVLQFMSDEVARTGRVQDDDLDDVEACWRRWRARRPMTNDQFTRELFGAPATTIEVTFSGHAMDIVRAWAPVFGSHM